MAGATVLALLINAPHVSADDDIIIFGGEFDDEAAAEGEELVLSAVRVKPYFNEGVSF